MKKSKLLSFLLLPVLAVGALAGCSSSKVSTTPYNTFINMQLNYGNAEGRVNRTDYQRPVFSSATNSLYYVKEVSSDEDAENVGKYDIQYLLAPQYNVSLLNADNQTKIRNKETLMNGTQTVLATTSKVFQGYYGILKVQDSIANGVYNYYNNWANRFYYSIAKCKVDKNEVKEFNKRMDNLVNVTRAFNNAKRVFETSCTTASGTNVHTFVFNSFAKVYNDFIECSINFVDYFKTLHLKYVIGDNAYVISEQAGSDSVQRIKDEAILNIAKVLYYENLKSANYSDCNLSDLTKDLVESENADALTNKYAKVLFKYLNKTTSTLNKSDGAIWVANGAALDALVDETVFKAINLSFNQKYWLYKKVYDSVDMYAYNRARSGYGNVTKEAFINTQSAELKTKYSFIDDFFSYTFSEYANKVLDCIN